MKLEAEVRRLQETVAQLQVVVKQLRDENTRLQAEVEQLRSENTQLKEQLEQLGGQRKPPVFVKANRPKKGKQTRRKRAAEHNRGRRREEPTRIERRRLEVCPACGEGLTEGHRHYERQVVDIPPPQAVEVVEYQIEKGWCWQCRQWRYPEVDWRGVVVGRGRIGVRLMGLVGYMRAILRVPVRTMQQFLATVYQIQLSVGEINALSRRLVAELQPAVAQLQKEVRDTPVAHMDETGWREDGQNGYIWCLVSDTPQPVRYFEYHRSRSGDVMKEMLAHFKGHLVSDFYSGYNKYSGPHQRCWAHLLRDLAELREKHADDAPLVAWISGVKSLYVYAQQQLQQQLTPAERQQLHDRLRGMAECFGLQYAQANHPCRALAKRLLRHLDELFPFVIHGHVAADNNLAERALRPLVVQRKISGGSRSPGGSETRMSLASLFETWKARHLNPLLESWRHLGYVPQSLPP